jgi:hypothetical protein
MLLEGCDPSRSTVSRPLSCGLFDRSTRQDDHTTGATLAMSTRDHHHRLSTCCVAFFFQETKQSIRCITGCRHLLRFSSSVSLAVPAAMSTRGHHGPRHVVNTRTYCAAAATSPARNVLQQRHHPHVLCCSSDITRTYCAAAATSPALLSSLLHPP